MIISDLDYLKSVANYCNNSAITGGFYHPSRLALQHIILFEQKFERGPFTDQSSGGYLANHDGKVMGIFSSSQTSNRILSY